MNFTKLSASLVNGSGMILTNENGIIEQIRSLFENKIDDYALIGKGKEICLALLGDDIRPPITSIYGTFEYNGNEYGIGIPNDDAPARIQVILENYDKSLSAKIAMMNIEAKYNAKEINIKDISEKKDRWIFSIYFKGIDFRKVDYSNMKKCVTIFKDDGNYLVEDIKEKL